MKRLRILMLALPLLVAGCDDDGPAAPSAQPLVFSALLSPAEEVPRVTDAEAGGRGAMQVTIFPTRDASGGITAATADFHFQLTGFPAGTVVFGAHIHTGVAGTAGGVRVNTGLTGVNPLILSDGSGTLNVFGITVAPTIAQGIIDDPAAWYFNVHSPANPGGMARGQLMRVQ